MSLKQKLMAIGNTLLYIILSEFINFMNSKYEFFLFENEEVFKENISKLLLDLAYDKIIKLLMILLMKKCLKIPSGF